MLRQLAMISLGLGSLFSLSGCLVDQSGPKNNTSPVMPPLEGRVLMIDNEGLIPQGQFLALFAKIGEAKRALTASYAALTDLRASNDRSGDCQFDDQAPSREAQATMVSVGDLGLAHSQQDPFKTIADSGDHKYLLALPSGFSSDMYFIYAKGSSEVPKFYEAFWMPEPIEMVKINDTALFSTNLHVKKSQIIKVQWTASPIADVRNQIAFQLSATLGNGHEVSLLCQAAEDPLPYADGVSTWEITPSQIANFPTVSGVTLTVMRFSVENDKAPLNVQMAGIRQVKNLVTVDP